MIINWRDILGEISGYKQLYDQTALELTGARTTIANLTTRLSEAQDTIHSLELICTRPAAPAAPVPDNTTPVPPAPDNTTETDTAPVQPQEANVSREIRTQQVIDCPKEKRVVPLTALAAGANHDQFTCRHCPHYKTETCNYVTCKYV